MGSHPAIYHLSMWMYPCLSHEFMLRLSFCTLRASCESIAHESSSAYPCIAGKSNESSTAPTRIRDHLNCSMTGGRRLTFSSSISTHYLLSGPDRICEPVRNQAARSGLQICQTDQAFGAIEEDQLALSIYMNRYSYIACSVQ
jgi:hypothetical protein